LKYIMLSGDIPDSHTRELPRLIEETEPTQDSLSRAMSEDFTLLVTFIEQHGLTVMSPYNEKRNLGSSVMLLRNETLALLSALFRRSIRLSRLCASERELPANLKVGLRNATGRELHNEVANVLRDELANLDGLLVEFRTTKVVGAIRCFRLDNKRLPESLDELVPTYLKDVPTDPYTRRPVEYSKENREIRGDRWVRPCVREP
jgi:hypothetical protein